MIPAHWRPHHREVDGELVGYLVPSDRGEVLPVTIFGHPLGDRRDEEDARDLLDVVGLACLADPWDLHLSGRDEPIMVLISEASPERLIVRNVDSRYEGELGEPFVLPVPVGGLLTPRR